MPPQNSGTQSYVLDGKTYTVPAGTSMDELDAYIKGGEGSQNPKTEAPAASQRAARRNAMAQPGITPEQRAASPVNQGIEKGLEDTAKYAPLLTGIDAPLSTAVSMGSGYLLGKGTRLGAKALGAGEGVQDAAEFGGNLVGSVAGGGLTPGLRNLRLRAPDPTEAELLEASTARTMARRAALQTAKEKAEGVPAQSLAQSPNLPQLRAARLSANQAAREAMETKAQTGADLPKLRPGGVLRLPEPREALPTENPNYLPSIPRERLPGLALQGYPGAGDLLKNEGQPIIYTVPEYPGPRPASAAVDQPRPRVIVIRPAAD
jgi:hypothetical protein